MATGQISDEAQLHTASLQRLSSLVRNLFLFFFTVSWCHRGSPPENWMYANNVCIHDKQRKRT